MRFRSQLVIGYSALLVVLIGTGAAAVLALRVTTSRLDHVTTELRADLTAVQWLRFEERQLIGASRAFLLGDAKGEPRFADADARLEATLAELEQQVGDRMTEIEADVHRYVAIVRTAAAERSAESGAVDPMLDKRVVPARDRLDNAVDAFVRRERAGFERESDHVRDQADRMQALVILATAIGVFLSVGLAWLWIRKLEHTYALEREATATAHRAVETRDEMLAIVSHDLRNPLSTITMAASLLQLDPGSRLVGKHAASITNASIRMDHLIGELLDVAKLDAGKLELCIEACSVASLFDATVSLFQTRATEANIELVVELDHGFAVEVDRECVLQVLSNLVGNAFKYTSAGGRVTLAARATGERTRIEVADTGAGIAADQLPHVFERHYQARARGRGSLGLGLYICRQLIVAHRGRIGVTSEPGKGSTFWFELPA